MRRILTGCAAALMLALPGAARALCDVIYKVQSDDTLLSIAAAHYEVSDQWTLIYYANQSALAGHLGWKALPYIPLLIALHHMLGWQINPFASARRQAE